jgi:hypothetical protein
MAAAAVIAAVCSAAMTGASAAAAGAYAATARAPASGGGWGTAQEVPGTAGLNQGGVAQILSVSCGAAGNCSAGGFYVDGSSNEQAFVVNEVNGTWGTAAEVPGSAAFNQGGSAWTNSVSCASAGNCSAGGFYKDASGLTQAFVANEVKGMWHTAKEVPGTAALNQGGNAQLSSVSCASAGNCSAGGFYGIGSSAEAFVVSEVNGTWHTAKEMPGTAALNQGGNAQLSSVSCASAGNCSAGGTYEDASAHFQAFVASQKNGIWYAAKEVPRTATLNRDGSAGTSSVSCGSAGNCSAVGSYTDGSGDGQVFVVREVNGTWRTAEEVPGTAALNQLSAAITSVSCASAGNCSAGGSYANATFRQQAFIVSEVNGTWRTAKEVPGIATLNVDRNALTASVSCASAGNCSAGGFYTDGSGHQQAFVVSDVNGTWHTAEEVPGTAALNHGGADMITSVSCASAGNCGAGGWYYDIGNNRQAFVVSKT